MNQRHDEQKAEAFQALTQKLEDSREELVQSAGETVVREVETTKKEEEKQGIEDKVRAHLRGFSRTIPSFLMAYGEEGTTLANFDTLIPADVFQDVTSITVDEFRFLRDGGDYTDGETGEVKRFVGHLFDEVVFNDSVSEFIKLRERLANYFDESQTEDIFDYVPPQKTNQIFTPRNVVVQMVDLFEKENPGCFDDPSHTFADLYMKSGLYITEIIKRLYRSEGMKLPSRMTASVWTISWSTRCSASRPPRSSTRSPRTSSWLPRRGGPGMRLELRARGFCTACQGGHAGRLRRARLWA